VSRIEQSGRMSRRPKHPIKGGSAPEEEETSVESDDFQGTHNQSISSCTKLYLHQTKNARKILFMP